MYLQKRVLQKISSLDILLNSLSRTTVCIKVDNRSIILDNEEPNLYTEIFEKQAGFHTLSYFPSTKYQNSF